MKRWIQTHRLTLASTLLTLALLGRFGGLMTHGRGLLARFVPAVLRERIGLDAGPLVASAGATPPDAEVFAKCVQPVLQKYCIVCHGAQKQKAELRLDSLEKLLRGGKDGPVVKFGRAQDSLLLQRLLLPLAADGRMPPEDGPQPRAEEVRGVEFWINAAATGPTHPNTSPN